MLDTGFDQSEVSPKSCYLLKILNYSIGKAKYQTKSLVHGLRLFQFALLSHRN
ncbi:MAG: hypothetical protein ACJARN_000251 [Arenicella sp.]|jgi:hypothetical protein